MKVTLSEVTTLTPGFAFKSKDFKNGNMPVLKIADIQGQVRCSNVSKVNTDAYTHAKLEKYLVKPGDCLVAMTGNTIGKIGRVSEGTGLINQRVLKINPADNKILDSEYLWGLLQLNSFHRHIINHIDSHSAQPNISASSIGKFSFDLPELNTQIKISKILASIRKKAELNNRINDYLAELASLEFSRRFGPDTPTTELGKVLSISTKSLKPQDCIGDIWEHYSIPAYDENRRPIFEPAECIKSNKYIVDTNCILISKLNPTIKRIWMPACTSDHPVCSTEFIVYKPNNLKHKSFYYAAINAPEFTDYLLAHVTGSTGSRQRTQPKATLKYPMQAPSVEAIDEFCAFADPIYEQIKLNELESGELEVLRDTLLPKLISGEIDVSKVKLPKQLNNHLCDH